MATFGSADMSELAVNMKKSCCFEMLRCHSIQIRDSQASYLSDTGEYLTKKSGTFAKDRANFCQQNFGENFDKNINFNTKLF